MPRAVLALIGDSLQLLALGMRSHTHLAAENLFLRKQLAFYGERRRKPRRLDDATRLTLVVLARFIEWRRLLTVVQPETLLRWHRQAFRLFWWWKSRRRGRPRLPTHLQELIAEMTRANRTWGEERIAAELLLSWAFLCRPGRCLMTTVVAHTRVSALGSQTGRVSRQDQPVNFWTHSPSVARTRDRHIPASARASCRRRSDSRRPPSRVSA